MIFDLEIFIINTFINAKTKFKSLTKMKQNNSYILNNPRDLNS